MTTSAGEQVPGQATFPAAHTPEGTEYRATSWASPFYDFTVPSGQLCQLKKVGLDDLLGAGLLDVFNVLGVQIDTVIGKAKGKPPMDMEKLLTKADNWKALGPVFDKVVVAAVTQPKVHPLPPEDKEREPGLVYVDHIGFGDKVAILSEVMGNLDMEDLKSLRKQSKRSA